MTRFYIVPVEDEERNLDTRFVGQIRSFPELIHCRECKHFDPDEQACNHGHGIILQENNWYCPDAERKADNA